MINELTTAMSSAEDFSDAFSRLFDEEMNIMDPASATTSAVLAPEAVPFRQNPTLARLSAIRQDTRSLDYSRERRRVPRPQLLPLRPVSRNRNIRRIAFARVMSRLAHRLSQPHVTSNAAKRTDLPNPSDPSGIQRTMQRGRDTTGGPLMLRRVRSAGPVLGRERKIEMEVTSLPPVSQSQTTGPQDVATSRETMHEELLDTSILITCNDGRLFHVYDYNTLKAASSWFTREIDRGLRDGLSLMSLQDEDGNFLKIVLDIIALPWPTLDSAIYNLFQKSPFSWSSFEDVAALYQRFERYDIRSACTFLRRILPDYAWTHPQMALKFALERGSMKDVAFAAIRNFSLVLADTSGNAFWECVSKTRARLQNTEEKEAREWQAEAHFLFVRCIYAASPQLFQHPQSSVDDWKYVAQDFLEELDQLEAWQVAQRLARRVHQEDSAIIYVGPQPLAGGDPQETLVDEQAQSQESVFSQAYFNRYFLPTQAELMTYTNPLTIIPSDSFMTGLNFYRDRDSAFQQPGVSATSAPDAHPNSFVFVMSSEGILFEAPASQISTASPVFAALINLLRPGDCIQSSMPALILEFVIDVMCDKQANLTADVAAIFANGDPSKASPLNTLCHLEKIAYLLQIPKLANLVNNSLPNTARNHPALAFAEALQQVPIHKKLAYAALRHFDIELADKCCFHFWRRICAIQASKFYDVNFNEYEWQRLAHLRFVLAIYSERPLKTSRVRAGFDWKHIALRFLEYMCSEEPDFVPSGGDETSVAGPSGTSGG